MTQYCRLRYLSAVFAYLLLLNLAACFQANLPKPPELDYPLPEGELWSEPDTWSNLPVNGSVVEIPEGKTVVLDINTPKLAGLMIRGKLVFAHGNLELTSDWIAVKGTLQIGSPEKPFSHEAIITITGKAGKQTALSPGMGNKVLAVQGGQLDLYGQEKVSWTRLDKTARAGDSELILETEVDWQAGDHIVIASTDFDHKQAEQRIVKSVAGRKVKLDLGRGDNAHYRRKLAFEHWGEKENFDGHIIDERAEVGLLSRNILIRGDEASEAFGFGAHMMVMKGSVVHISGVEFHRMGQRGELARYPVHWHLAGEATGSFIKNSSIHRSFNRCVTIHGTHNLRIEANVAYDAVGHCYFLEDGIEQNNRFENNLGLSIVKPNEGEELLPSDQELLGPAVYWITNPNNIIRNNVAAGSQGTGFWLAFPEHPTGASATTTVWPRRTPLTEFSGNVSHSNQVNGLHLDNGPTPTGETEVVRYVAYLNPEDPSSTVQKINIDGFVAYKNRVRGAWLRGHNFFVNNSVFADNAIGMTFVYREVGVDHDYSFAQVSNSIFIGESANKGTPPSASFTGLDGRSLARSVSCDGLVCEGFVIRGFEYYDGVVGVENSYFGKFESNALYQAAALSHLDFTDFSVSVNNFARGLSFGEGTNRVYLATRPLPEFPKKGSEDGYRSAVIFDEDGSVTGGENSYIVVDNAFMHGENCQKRTAWNAWVCEDSQYVALALATNTRDLKSIVITRNDGITQTLFGAGKPPSYRFRSLLIPNKSYKLDMNLNLPQSLRLALHEGRQSWLNLEIPYAGKPRILRDDRILEPVSSLAELTRFSKSSYYFDSKKKILHIRIYGEGERELLTIFNLED